MSQNAPKIVIVVLVIVVVLFFVGVGVGAGGQNNGQGGLPGISIDSAINTFSGLIPAPAVALNEITNASPSDCFDAKASPPTISISITDGCSLDIKNSDQNIRALKLKLKDNQSVHIESTSDPVDKKPMLTKLDLPSQNGAQVTLNFFKTNGSVKFSNCVPDTGNICTLTIVS